MKSASLLTAPFSFFRFFAAWIVLLFHFAQKTSFFHQIPKVLIAGPQMVTFFFVLSGFMLFLGYHQRETLSLRRYFLKRAVRILPLYLLALILSAIQGGSCGQWEWWQFWLNLAGVQSWFPHPTALNFTSWFVSNLLFFYALFPSIFQFLKSHKPGAGQVLFVTAMVWGLTQGILVWLLNSGFYQGYPSYSHELLFYNPLSHVGSFLLGVGGAYWVRESNHVPGQGWLHSSLVTLFLLAFLGLLIQGELPFIRRTGVVLPFEISLYAPLFLALILHVVLSKNCLLFFLSQPIFVSAGEISYGLYILQAPLDLLYHRLLPARFVVQPDANFFIFSGVLLGMVSLLCWMERRGMERFLATQQMQRMIRG